MINSREAVLFLRAEGLVLGLLCIWLYGTLGGSWWLFAALILAPDLAMLGYLAGPRWGALAYNVVHSWVSAALLFAFSWWGGLPGLLPFAFILGAHIGFDRAMGFGLKLPSGFKDTHLGSFGKNPAG